MIKFLFLTVIIIIYPNSRVNQNSHFILNFRLMLITFYYILLKLILLYYHHYLTVGHYARNPFFTVQLKIEEASRRLRSGDLGIPLNPEDRFE